MRALLILAAIAAFDFGLVWVFQHSGYWRSPEEQAREKAQRWCKRQFRG